MTVFLTTLMCILVAAIGTTFGLLWFKCCPWDETWHSRNYKTLVIVIPVTFFLVYALVDPPAKGSVTAPLPSLLQVIEKKPLVKKKVKKKIKKQEEDNNDDSIQFVPLENPEENHD